MNWRRIALITVFDLRCSVFRLKGLIFLLPFFLFWYLLLREFYDGLATRLQSSEILMLLSAKFDMDLIARLLVDHPPSLSAFFIFGLYSTPFFAVLAANDSFASDLGNGYFRFLTARCQRIEIFLGRYLSTFSLFAASLSVVTVAAGLISIFIEGYTFSHVLVYSIQIISIMILYAAPYLAFMTIISCMFNSAIAALSLGMLAYISIVFTIFILNGLFSETNSFSYLLPSSAKTSLISDDSFAFAVASLPAYTLIYAWLGWVIFRKRNF